MGGRSALWVPPSSASFTALTGRRQILKLTPGYPDGTPVATGLATANNLVELSPPTLLEAFDIYSLAIAWGAGYTVPPAPGSQLIAELRILVNGHPTWIATDQVNVTTDAIAGSWSADLVNPIRLGARDRLGLEVGVEQLAGIGFLMIGAQPSAAAAGSAPANWTLVESTISYTVLDVPAARTI